MEGVGRLDRQGRPGERLLPGGVQPGHPRQLCRRVVLRGGGDRGLLDRGATVTLSDPTYDAASNETRFDCADAAWTSSTITASGAIVYKYDATAGLAYLIQDGDFGESKSSESSTFTITMAAAGLLKIAAA